MAEVIDADDPISSTPPRAPSRDTASNSTVNSASKKPRFRFTTELDLLLCKAVSEKGAHAPPVNEKTKLMQEACMIFITALPTRTREKYVEPKGKTINDRFELLVTNRRREDGKTRAASGISEERKELDELLDDLILRRDEVLEARRKQADEKTALDKRLDDAAKDIRSKAMYRKTADETKDGSEKSEHGEERSKKKRKVVTLDSDDEELELLRESIAERRENERKKMEIDQQRLDLERERAEQEREDGKRKHELEKKRLEIEEAKVELERQKTMSELAERRAGIEERKAMVGALSGLAKKFA